MRVRWDKLETLPSLAAVRAAADALPREVLLSMLQWNDRNSSWTDKEADREGVEHATKAQAVDAVVEIVDQSIWRHDDPRRIKKNPGAGFDRIKAALAAAFAKIQDELLTRLRKAYRDELDRNCAKLFTASQDPSRKGKIFDRFKIGREVAAFYGYRDWIVFDTEAARKSSAKVPYNGIETWEDLRAMMRFITPSYRTADAAAQRSYENARDSFIGKNETKFENVLGHREDVQDVEVAFGFHRGVFEGTLKVMLSNATLLASLSLKFVVRHIPNVTPYYQYPLVFSSCTVDGKKYAAPSEEELRILLGGGTREQVEAQKRAAAAAAGFCPMGGMSIPSGVTREPRYLNCPSCGAYTSIQNWKFRKHKTPAAEKKSAAAKLTESGYCPMSREKVPADVIASIGPVEGYKDPKARCQACGQQVRIDSERDWIWGEFMDGDRPTRMRVKSAKYYKHKVV